MTYIVSSGALNSTHSLTDPQGPTDYESVDQRSHTSCSMRLCAVSANLQQFGKPSADVVNRQPSSLVRG